MPMQTGSCATRGRRRRRSRRIGKCKCKCEGLFWYLISAVGTGWGESGYMLIAMNKDNICGVLSMPVGLCTGKAFEEEIAVY